MFYQDTSGYWTAMVQGIRPDVAIIAAAGRGNIDGEPIQGSLAQFVGREAALLRPRRIVLGHHDNWLPGFSASTDVAPFREELAGSPPVWPWMSSATWTATRSSAAGSRGGAQQARSRREAATARGVLR